MDLIAAESSGARRGVVSGINDASPSSIIGSEHWPTAPESMPGARSDEKESPKSLVIGLRNGAEHEIGNEIGNGIGNGIRNGTGNEIDFPGYLQAEEKRRGEPVRISGGDLGILNVIGIGVRNEVRGESGDENRSSIGNGIGNEFGSGFGNGFGKETGLPRRSGFGGERGAGGVAGLLAAGEEEATTELSSRKTKSDFFLGTAAGSAGYADSERSFDRYPPYSGGLEGIIGGRSFDGEYGRVNEPLTPSECEGEAEGLISLRGADKRAGGVGGE